MRSASWLALLFSTFIVENVVATQQVRQKWIRRHKMQRDVPPELQYSPNPNDWTNVGHIQLDPQDDGMDISVQDVLTTKKTTKTTSTKRRRTTTTKTTKTTRTTKVQTTLATTSTSSTTSKTTSTSQTTQTTPAAPVPTSTSLTPLYTVYPTNNQAKKWTFTLGNYTEAQNPWPNLKIFYHVTPDGYLPVIKHPDQPNKWIFFWSEATDYRSTGPSPFPELQTTLEPLKTPGQPWPKAIFGGDQKKWLMAVHPHPYRKGRLVAFYHCQDHTFHVGNQTIVTSPSEPAWKWIGQATSDDNGITWTDNGPIILSSRGKPSQVAWSGVGDFGAVWDFQRAHWKLYYSEDRIGIAISEDPEGKPGTWTKWNGTPDTFRNPWNPTGNPVQPYVNGQANNNVANGYSTKGLGGTYQWLPGLNVGGANPAICWNTYLQRWVMSYSVWQSGLPRMLYMSSSKDGLNWDNPQPLVSSYWTDKGCPNCRAWYSTFIDSQGGSTVCGRNFRVYYSDGWTREFTNWDSSKGCSDCRKLVYRDITLTRLD